MSGRGPTIALQTTPRPGQASAEPSHDVLRNVSQNGGMKNVEGNCALTVWVAVLLLVLLAVEGLTLVSLQTFLPVHIYVGMLLLAPVTLKLASVGYRFARYYLGDPDYRAAGPPPLALRALRPLVVLSTAALFGTGVALVFLGHAGLLLGLHKGSFVVWFGAMSVHVLGHAQRVVGSLRRRVPGTGRRLVLVGVSLAVGLVVATATIPTADHWQDRHLPEAYDV